MKAEGSQGPLPPRHRPPGTWAKPQENSRSEHGAGSLAGINWQRALLVNGRGVVSPAA